MLRYLEAAVVRHPVPDRLLRLGVAVLVPAEADLAAAHPGQEAVITTLRSVIITPQKSRPIDCILHPTVGVSGA